MTDGNIHTYSERHGGNLLQWTNRVDAAGSRIEWQITTDNQGWVSRYGPVCNDGVYFGSKVIANTADEKALLVLLRQRAGMRNSPLDAPGESLAA